MTDVINNIVTDKQEIKDQLGNIPDIMKIPKRFESRIALKEVLTEYNIRTYDGSANVFILNSPQHGVLGTNKLGDSASSDELYAIIPCNNIYYEYFGQLNYINTITSTGTIDTIIETYVLDLGETLESEIICKPRGPINKVHFFDNNSISDFGEGMELPFVLGESTFNDNNVNISMSNDNGVTWHDVVEGVDFVFNTTTNDDELLYRIKNVSSSEITIENPLVIKIN